MAGGAGGPAVVRDRADSPPPAETDARAQTSGPQDSSSVLISGQRLFSLTTGFLWKATQRGAFASPEACDKQETAFEQTVFTGTFF